MKCNPTLIENLIEILESEQIYCVPSESTVFLLSNDMHFGYINGIAYHLIDSLISIADLKCCIL